MDSPHVHTKPLHMYVSLNLSTAPSRYPLLPAVISLVVVVLLLTTCICVALLALALAAIATKLNKLRAEKAHTDPLYYYNQTGGGEGETKDRTKGALSRAETGYSGEETV